MMETGTDVTNENIIDEQQREIDKLEYELAMAKHATATKHTKLVKAKAQLKAVLDEKALLKGQLETLPVLTSASDSWMKRATTAEKQLEAFRIAIKNERNKRDSATGFIQVLEAIIGDN